MSKYFIGKNPPKKGLENFTLSEINILNDVFPNLNIRQVSDFAISTYLNAPVKVYKYEVVEISSVKVYKYEDEWFLVEISSKFVEYKKVLCDQIDGLIDLIKNLNDLDFLSKLQLRIIKRKKFISDFDDYTFSRNIDDDLFNDYEL